MFCKRSCYNWISGFTNLLTALNVIMTIIDSAGVVELCFLNFSKTFDVVNHRIACFKSERLSSSSSISVLGHHFLTDHSLRVRVEHLCSSRFPQVSALGGSSWWSPFNILLAVCWQHQCGWRVNWRKQYQGDLHWIGTGWPKCYGSKFDLKQASVHKSLASTPSLLPWEKYTWHTPSQHILV